MRRFFSAAAAALFAFSAFAQRDPSQVEITAEKFSDTTYMLRGSGGNMGLSVGPDAVFLVDDQYAPLTPKIVAAIAKITPMPVRFVLNTHWHGDHVGGNENLGRAGALVVAHENVRKRMDSEQFNEFMRTTVKPSPKAALPVVTFTADLTWHINGDEVRVFHVARAHTDGDAIVHFVTSDVIHMGDVYWNGLYPFIDAASGGTVDGTIAAVARGLALAGPNTKIIPGHGPLASKADLQAYRDMLATVAGRVKKLIAEGRKLEEIVATPVSAEFDAKWGTSFIKPAKFAAMIALIYLKN
jgi:glyoxylase-like metal-dependent hydrolase (beta-lactamase superfamily II)